MSQNPPMTVYGTPNCVQCTRTVITLEKAGLEEGRDFRYRDLSQDPAALAYVKEDLGYGAAPVVVLDEQDHWYGFRPDHLKKAIAWALAARDQVQESVLQPGVDGTSQPLVLTAAGPEPPTVTATSTTQVERAHHLERQALQELAEQLRQEHGPDRVVIRQHSQNDQDLQVRHDDERAITITAEYSWNRRDDDVGYTVRSADTWLTQASGSSEQRAATPAQARELVAVQRDTWGPGRPATPAPAPVLNLSARIAATRDAATQLATRAAAIGTAVAVTGSAAPALPLPITPAAHGPQI